MFDVDLAAARAREASRTLAYLPSAAKNSVLRSLATRIVAARAEILAANRADMDEASRAGLTGAKVRRLEMTSAGVDHLAASLSQIADLADPVGQVTVERDMPSGLHVRRVRSPLGVIAMIYEARPGVTVDAFALCFKAGNACLLKGGKEAARSNRELATLCRAALTEHRVPEDAVQLVDTSDRTDLLKLLTLDQHIDLVIPRGGKDLIRFVRDHSKIPTIQHYEGICHIFVDETADLDKAVEVCATAKTSAPATCNAAECVLVHEKAAAAFIPRMVQRYVRDGVEVRGDEATQRLAPSVRAAASDDFGREFLDLIIAMRVVPDMDAAIAHINRYGSNHTESILTRDERHAAEFASRVQSSVVVVNASTRFNDGFSLGLGAEIGISTTKLHAYGPMGLEELTTQRYVVVGDGHTR